MSKWGLVAIAGLLLSALTLSGCFSDNSSPQDSGLPDVVLPDTGFGPVPEAGQEDAPTVDAPPPVDSGIDSWVFDAGEDGADAAIDSTAPDAADSTVPDVVVPDAPPPPPDAGADADAAVQVFTVGGTLSGLAPGDSVALTDTTIVTEPLTLTADGPFTFKVPVLDGGKYAVAISSQPKNPAQNCVLANGSGTIAGADVTNVTVTCTTQTFTVGGTLTGLATGDSITLQDNGGDNLTLNANGTFTFATPIASGAKYAVSVGTQPANPPQQCTVSAAAGTVGSANVTSVVVNCATNSYTVGGSISGLAFGSSVHILDNGGDGIYLSTNGSFAFPTPLPSGMTYAVTVAGNPDSPVSETCNVSSGTGTVGSANVTSVSIVCTPNPFAVGGTLSGLLAGDSVTLQDNGGDNLVLNANGPFTFATPVPSGTTYTVTAVEDPTIPQVCVVTSGTGTITDRPVTTVQVTCGLVQRCADIQRGGVVTDGTYVIFPSAAQHPFPVYCLGMNLVPCREKTRGNVSRFCGTPQEYLNLVHSAASGEPQSNYARVGGGGQCSLPNATAAVPCADVTSTWTKVALCVGCNPILILPGDRTFATFVDSSPLSCYDQVGGACQTEANSVAYGTAWNCNTSDEANRFGQANMDLRDTGFYFASNVFYAVEGSMPFGSGNVDQSSFQVANATGGGACGDDTPSTSANSPGGPIPITQTQPVGIP